jgi:hypothetical protein
MRRIFFHMWAAMYPKDSEEKRPLDAMVLAMPE